MHLDNRAMKLKKEKKRLQNNFAETRAFYFVFFVRNNDDFHGDFSPINYSILAAKSEQIFLSLARSHPLKGIRAYSLP